MGQARMNPELVVWNLRYQCELVFLIFEIARDRKRCRWKYMELTYVYTCISFLPVFSVSPWKQ